MTNKKSKGQLVLFGVIFIIVVLFMFGMVNGVGMFIHHKINAQNSVDIGSIYAAQKQAQTLSVLSHLNYQLRQNYKLFSYRYNVLGNVGAYRRGSLDEHLDLLEKSTQSGKMQCSNIEGGACKAQINRDCNGCRFAFCIWHPFFHIPGKGDDQNNCQNVFKPFKLPKTIDDKTIVTLGALYANRITQRGIKEIKDACNLVGMFNWTVASSVFLSFYEQQETRRKFIEDYFNKIIAQDRDLSGKPISTGVERTITKNFTFPLAKSFDERGGSIVFKTSARGKSFDDFFEWTTIEANNLDLNYVQDTKDLTKATACTRDIVNIFDCEKFIEGSRCDKLQEISTEPLTIGFTVKQDRKSFYNQIFLNVNYHGGVFFPFREPVDMVAEAYSKPFGASLGPPQRDPLSNSGYPNHYLNLQKNPTSEEDSLGILSFQKQYYLNKLIDEFIKARDASSVEAPKEAGFSMINYQELDSDSYNSAMVVPFDDVTSSSSVVPLNMDRIFTLPARVVEEIAIAPDEYDLNHYTILPNYMLGAYMRLMGAKNQRGDEIFKDVPPDIGHFSGNEEFLKRINLDTIRGDLFEADKGPSYKAHIGDRGILKSGTKQLPFFLNYIEKQINWVNLFDQQSYHGNTIDFKIYFNKILKIDDLLTSWVPSMNPQNVRTIEDLYPPVSPQSIGEDCKAHDVPFQCCHLRDTELSQGGRGVASLEVATNKEGIPYLKWKTDTDDAKRKHILNLSHCIIGGRTGFSVKIIDKSYPGVTNLLR